MSPPFMDFDKASEASFSSAIMQTRSLADALKLVKLAGMTVDKAVSQMVNGIERYTVNVKASTAAGKEATIVIRGSADAAGQYQRAIDEVNSSLEAQAALEAKNAADLRRKIQLTAQYSDAMRRAAVSALRQSREGGFRGVSHTKTTDAETGQQTRIINLERPLADGRKMIRTIQTLNGELISTRDRVTAISRATARVPKHMHDIGDKTEEANKKVQEMNISWKSMIRLVAVQLAHRAISAMTRGFADGVRQIIELEKRIAEIQTISQDKQLAFSGWLEGLREVSDLWGIGIADQAEATYQAISNQIAKGSEALEFLAQANQFAVTAVTKATSAVQLGTAALNAYHMEASQADQVFAQFFKTIELGRVRASEMANSFGDVAVLASQAGVRLSELQAITATLTIQGIAWSKANTQVRGILIKLLKPTSQMKKLLASIGAESGEAAVKMYGFGGLLNILQERTKGSSTELAKFINRIRGISGALALTGLGFIKYQENLVKIEDASASYEAATELVIKTTGKRLEIEFNKIKNYFIKDVGKELLEWVDLLTFGFTAISGAVKYFAQVLTNVLVGSLVLVMAKFKILWATATKFIVANPYLTGLLAIAAAAAVIQRLINAYTEAEIERIDKREEAHKNHYKQLIKEAERHYEITINLLKRYEQVHLTTLATVQGHYSQLQEVVAGVYETQQKAVKKYASVTSSALSKMITKATNNINRLQSSINKQTATIKGLQVSLGGKLFDIDLDTTNPEKKMLMLKNRIDSLIKKGSEAAVAGDASVVTQIWTEITNRQTDLYNISLAQGKKTEKQTKMIAKLQRQQLDVEMKYNIERAAAERQLARFAKDRNSTEAEIQNAKDAIKRIDNARFKQIREISFKLEGIKLHHHDIAASKARFIELNNKQIEQLKKVQAAEVDRLKKMTAQKILSEKQVLDFKKYYEAYIKFDLGKTLAGGDYAKAQKAIEARLVNSQAMQKLIKDTGVGGITDVQFDKDREILVKALDNLAKITEAAAKHKEAADKREEIAGGVKYYAGEIKKTEKQMAKADQLLGVFRSTVKLAAAEGDWLYQYKAAIAHKQFHTPDAISGEERNTIIKEAAAAMKAYDEVKTYETGKVLAEKIDVLFKNISKFYLGQEKPGHSRIEQGREFTMGIQAGKFAMDQLLPLASQLDTEKAAKRKLIITIQEMDAVVEKIIKKKTEIEDEFNKEIAKKTLANSDKIRDTFIALHKEFAKFSAKIKAIEIKPTKKDALGGMIYPYGSDRVPAMLTPGEFVINPAQSRQFYSQLVAMNGGMSRFAGGGEVTNINGAMNISVNSNGNANTDAVAIGKALRREIRRGRVRLN